MLGEGNIVAGISSVVAADWLVVAGDSRMFAADVAAIWSIVASEWILTVADDLAFSVLVPSMCVFVCVRVLACVSVCVYGCL